MFDSFNAPYGLDLPSMDINRGRDFGLPNYNAFRKACGLCQLHSFQQLEPYIRNPAVSKNYFSNSKCASVRERYNHCVPERASLRPYSQWTARTDKKHTALM